MRFTADFFLVICVAIVAGCVVHETAQVRGTRDGIDVVANVRTLGDGGVRVEFNCSGATGCDPGPIDRISRAYERRMGR